MFLLQCVDAFSWQQPSTDLEVLHAAYVSQLRRRLAVHQKAIDAALGFDTLDGWLDEDVASFVCSPEVSYRLLWPTQHEPAEASAFVAQAAVAYAKVHKGRPTDTPTWAPTGDQRREPDGSLVVPWPEIHGLVVDAGSPFALTIDVTGERHRLSRPIEPLSPDMMRLALAKVEEAAQAIQTVLPSAWDVVRRFTKALVLLPDQTAPSCFASGSSGQFIGRSVLSNPQLAKVGFAHVAEALVHEAIHAVLYMDEQQDRWVLRPELYAGPLRIPSPWTGNSLPLRPYLQAIFVWYGILLFWSAALETGRFPRSEVRERLTVALSGFLRGPMLSRVAVVQADLAPELVAAVREAQANVLGLTRDLGLAQCAS